ASLHADASGPGPGGYGAGFDLLEHLGFPVARTHEAPEDLPPDATIWWIEPAGLCRARDGKPVAWAGWRAEPWVRAGGTAVLFLSAGAREHAECPLLEGVALPPRVARPPAAAR